MKMLFAILVTALITALLIKILPWWVCGIIAFLVCMVVRLRPGQAFLAGLFGAGLAWGIVAGWIDVRNSAMLSTRIGLIFGGVSSWIILVLTALIGGLTGGFGGMTGGALSSLISKHRKT